jgi:hypothetical protein
VTLADRSVAWPGGCRARRAAVAAAMVLAACQSRSGQSDSRQDSTAATGAAAAADRDASVADADTGAAGATDTTAPTRSAGEPPPSAGQGSAPRSGQGAGTRDEKAGGESPRPTPRRTAATATTADSVRGVVRVVGSSPFRQVVVSPSGGDAPVTLVGPDTATLRKAAGLEVVVRGSRTDGELRVTSFAVRSADGQPAVDGVLVRDGDGLALETAAGRVRLGNPPAALRDLVGARVWVAGPLDTGPNPFGVLKAKE